MKLGDLLSKIATVSVRGAADVKVTDVCSDSRKVGAGSLFVALPGTKAHGAAFIPEAIARGAVAVVSQNQALTGAAVSVQVADSRRALSELACAWFGRPSDALKVACVTGTNGKTTMAFLIQHICDSALMRCGLLGTVHYKIGDKILPATRTTPDAWEVQSLLAQMRDAGNKAAVMEVSSHAIVQQRVRGVEVDAAVFTNLTQDHLDYHGTMDAYFEAKAGFLLGLGDQRFKVGTAIVNADDRFGAQLLDRLAQNGVKTISFGFGSRSDFRASNCRTDFNSSTFQLDAEGRSWLVRLPLIGMFNISNALGALAAAFVMGVDLRTAVLSLASAPSVPGRMQAVPGKRAFKVFVDYAHTEDALRNTLRTLRDLQPRNLVTVFGCGGDRDATKRAPMGAAAEELSDWTILTSDNPRSEAPEKIIEDILGGMRRKTHEVVLDRKAAIERAIESAGPRDIILIAGKGHETVQEMAGKKDPFDDVAIAASVLENLPSDFGR
ncbi:MAG: 6-diaminopimelate ligase [Verrucomicrobia bacterium]|nr:MAG: 6-diaminopimelate ligase [Verrucomicrobiota bacterium]